MTTKTEQYRFENGSRFEYDADSNAYIHCYRRAGCNSKKQAIAEYEEQQNMPDPLDPTNPEAFGRKTY